MYQFVIDSAALLPYISGEKPLSELDPTLAAHVATLRDWQALYAVTRPPATTFAELDARSQAIYSAIAAALPGHAVYATGSRVKGTWRSGAPNDPKTAIAQRLGKPLESDVDVVVLDVDNTTFRQAVAPIAAAYGVRIDRQPATTHPQILVFSGQGDRETRRQGDKETRRQGDKEIRRQGDKETRRQGDKETRRQGDKETGRQGDRR